MPGGSGRIDALDGLRGIAVALVMVGHIFAEKLHVSRPVAGALGPLAYPQLGVLIFFVLSGYLITSILLRERGLAGRISLRRFYVRRALRIWPAFYAFLAVLALLAAIEVIVLSPLDLGVSALFAWNYYIPGDSWWVGHTWSLAVEQQFYLLWPLVLVRASPRTAAKLAIAVIVLAPLVRAATIVLTPSVRSHVNLMLHTRADSLMAGALIALLPIAYPALADRLRALASQRRARVVAVLTLIGSSCLHATGNAWPLLAGYTLETAASGVLLVAVAQAPPGVWRCLEWRPLVALGVISYSAYLWQQLFLGSMTTGVIGSIPVAIAATLLLATLSQRFVEAPFLRRKRRFEVEGGPVSR